jgi:hypothetical protein
MKLFWTLLFALMCISSPARACIDIRPFEIEGIKNASIIVVGEPLKYQRLPNGGLGFLEIRVRQAIKGSAPQKVQLVWGSLFGIREHLDLPQEVIIAADHAADPSYATRLREGGINQFSQSTLFRLLDSNCSAEFILDSSPQNVANIQKVLRGEKVVAHDYHLLINTTANRAYRVRSEKEQARREAAHIVVVALGIMTILVMLSVVLWKRRKPSP